MVPDRGFPDPQYDVRERWILVTTSMQILVYFHVYRLISSITADYAIIEGGKFNLTNTQRVGNPATGKIETFTGTLVNPDPSALGKWKIENMWFSFYWVVAVGTPVNGLYPWSIVSDPLGATSFVLARDVATYNLYYSAVVNGILEEEGLMKKWNEMHTTYQLGNCAYTW
jgi:hypothetical protein